MPIWNFISSHLKHGRRVILLYVLDSQGSSPGRKGFAMAVSETGVFQGTIGGGMMEVKLIELAKHLLDTNAQLPLIKEQFHDKTHHRNQSGLICSGQQTVLLLPLSTTDLTIVQTIASRDKAVTLYVDLTKAVDLSLDPIEQVEAISIPVSHPDTIHIFGAGHVGMALARQMLLLGYRVWQYDDRPAIYELQKNQLAWPLSIIDYRQLPDQFSSHPTDVVVIVSFSYRSDKIILQMLYRESFAYLGLMGSDHKIATLKQELMQEGVAAADLAHVYTPIGLPIYSKTAAEIAVSIAGQIIRQRNKDLPTGRQY